MIPLCPLSQCYCHALTSCFAFLLSPRLHVAFVRGVPALSGYVRSPVRCGFYNEVGAIDEERLAGLIPRGQVKSLYPFYQLCAQQCRPAQNKLELAGRRGWVSCTRPKINITAFLCEGFLSVSSPRSLPWFLFCLKTSALFSEK